jgi:hypothetical protein
MKVKEKKLSATHTIYLAGELWRERKYFSLSQPFLKGLPIEDLAVVPMVGFCTN